MSTDVDVDFLPELHEEYGSSIVMVVILLTE